MIVQINAEQEEKLDYIRGLRRRHSEHLENAAKLLETAIQTLDESEMALFLQVTLHTTPPDVGQHLQMLANTSRCWPTPAGGTRAEWEAALKMLLKAELLITDGVFLVAGHQTSATEVSEGRC